MACLVGVGIFGLLVVVLVLTARSISKSEAEQHRKRLESFFGKDCG